MFASITAVLLAVDVITPVDNDNSPWVVVLLALISVTGVIITAWFSYMAQKHAKEGLKQASEANDAVNHRQVGQDRLFDMVASTRDQVNQITLWKDKWDHIPDKLKDPQELAMHFAILEDRIKAVGQRVDDNHIETRNHIDVRIDSIENKVIEVDAKLENHTHTAEAKPRGTTRNLKDK